MKVNSLLRQIPAVGLSLGIILLMPIAFHIDATAHNIIPHPYKVAETGGTYRLDKLDFFVQNNARKADITEILRLKLQVPIGFPLHEVPQEQANLRFLTDAALSGDAYILLISSNGIEVRSSSFGGQFHALQTLLQLFSPEVKSICRNEGVEWIIPCIRIDDAPRFGWRGIMPDVSRHWFTKDEVMRFIDEIAEYKFNVFHWHLTDDQGWRVQIDSFPLLTSKGSKRAFRVGDWWSYAPQQPSEDATYGGYYTKDDIREVIAYAAQRNVSVMPEVDVPGTVKPRWQN